MPEGHTIHRLARDHRRWFAGCEVAVASPQGRFADAAAQVDGRIFEDAQAHGKHLFHQYAGGDVVHIHLGLFGKVFDHDVPAPTPRETVRYRVTGTSRAIDLVGATICELITPSEAEEIVGRLGPDPLRGDADPDRAYAALQRRSVPIGQALMDQRVVAGVGNVFRAEVLAAVGMHPLVPARAVAPTQWATMWSLLVEWLTSGVRSGRIVTVDPSVAAALDDDERPTVVYRQEHCRACGHQVRRWDLAGRWAYACESCQQPPEEP